MFKVLAKQKGMSLLESMMAMSIGVFLLGGVMVTFSSMRATTTETMGMGEVQENGRLAMSIIRRDIEHAGFWGQYQSQLSSDLLAIPAAPSSDCSGGSNSPNSGSFPVVSTWVFWSFYATSATTGNVLGCISNATTGSDVVQVKRAISNPTAVNEFRSNRFYLIASSTSAAIVSGAADASSYPSIDNANNWMYQHLVYYVAPTTLDGDSIPTLMRQRLIVGTGGAATMSSEPVIDGIENIRLMFGIDLDLDGRVDSYVGSESVARDYWNQGSSDTSYIKSVRIYVLARALEPDMEYTNNNTYTLGDRTINGGGDHFRRMLFSSTVSVINAVNGEWQ